MAVGGLCDSWDAVEPQLEASLAELQSELEKPYWNAKVDPKTGSMTAEGTVKVGDEIILKPDRGACLFHQTLNQYETRTEACCACQAAFDGQNEQAKAQCRVGVCPKAKNNCMQDKCSELPQSFCFWCPCAELPSPPAEWQLCSQATDVCKPKAVNQAELNAVMQKIDQVHNLMSEIKRVYSSSGEATQQQMVKKMQSCTAYMRTVSQQEDKGLSWCTDIPSPAKDPAFPDCCAKEHCDGGNVPYIAPK